jgi:hypothetical protein
VGGSSWLTPSACDQKRAAASMSSVRQSMMMVPRRLLCMAVSGLQMAEVKRSLRQCAPHATCEEWACAPRE